jgi:hypothetical protein
MEESVVLRAPILRSQIVISSFPLLPSLTEHEISGKSLAITLDLLVQHSGWHAIQLSQINIDHDLVAAN